MTAKDFNKEFKETCTKLGYTLEPRFEGDVRFVGETPFGKMHVISDPSARIKLYSIYFKFLEDFDIEKFFKYFSRNEVINKNSKKWNVHREDPKSVLIELDERLNNLNLILERDGKVIN